MMARDCENMRDGPCNSEREQEGPKKSVSDRVLERKKGPCESQK